MYEGRMDKARPLAGFNASHCLQCFDNADDRKEAESRKKTGASSPKVVFWKKRNTKEIRLTMVQLENGK